MGYLLHPSPEERKSEPKVRYKSGIFCRSLSAVFDSQQIRGMNRDDGPHPAQIEEVTPVFIDGHGPSEQGLRSGCSHGDGEFRLHNLQFAFKPLAAGFDLD